MCCKSNQISQCVLLSCHDAMIAMLYCDLKQYKLINFNSGTNTDMCKIYY